MREKITKRAVEAVVPADKDIFLWDIEIPGFGVKVTPKGARSYILQYSINKRERRITIGRHGFEFTAEQARNEARRLRGLIATNQDPSQKEDKDQGSETIAVLGKRYLEEYARPHKKPSGYAQDKRNLDNHIIPLIGKLLVAEIERQDISRLMQEVAAGKTAREEKTIKQGKRIVSGGEIVANRVFALMSKMLALAEDWHYRPAGANPCKGIKKFKENKIERFLSTDELSRLGKALDAARKGQLIVDSEIETQILEKRKPGGQIKIGPRYENKKVIDAITLLLLTGCRLGEILDLKWSHVDFERRMLLLPDSKTGRKIVYLSEQAIDVLKSITHDIKDIFVFPGKDPKQPIKTIRKPWMNICKAAGLSELRLHDLRHSFASVGASGGFSLTVIGALLGHSNPTTTARYAHLAASPVHQAADQIGSIITKSLKQKDVNSD
ncbi:MAG: DUF4102 domain-containing protein [Methylocystaceae bacterium]|nr:DUF4102 domain-containing protein [Methylocystaceae bacterium]